MLDELLATHGVEEQLVLRGAVGVCALHGGLEEGTAELAIEVAERAGASLYAVVQPADLRWHIPSHRYDPAHSRALGSFLDHVEVVISLHGFGGVREADDRWTTALLGGTNRELATRLGTSLGLSLPTYRWIGELEEIPSHLRGLHPANPVNRPRRGGVQIELPPRVRRQRADRDALIATLTAVATDESRRCNGVTPRDPVPPPPH